MTRLLQIQFVGVELMTGLPEYRNGGLLIDSGLLTLKEADLNRGLKSYSENAVERGTPKVEVVPMFKPDDDVVVEWRAVTVGMLDEIHKLVNEDLGLHGPNALSLAQVLEAGTWKVCRRCIRFLQQLTTTGWKGDCRSLKAKHQGAAHHDPI